jgi:murein DD-endopeptidase MepM/ murein hydrolase activator NlpD
MMTLDLLVPVRAGWKFLSKYRKFFIAALVLSLVSTAFVMGYRYGSLLNIQDIVFPSLGDIHTHDASGNNLEVQDENEDEVSDGATQKTAFIESQLEMGNQADAVHFDPVYVISELEKSGFNEVIHMPVDAEVDIPFGWRKDSMTEDWRYSNGIVFASNGEDKVSAAMSGIVISVTHVSDSYEIAMLHPFEITTYYHNLKSVVVKKDDQVKQGELLGCSGIDGLYFEVRQEGKVSDPQISAVLSK